MIKHYDSFCCFRSSTKSTKRLLWELTERCNLNCPYCHVHIKKNEYKELSTGEIFKILVQLKEFGINDIIFSGGEPLIRKDLIDILSKAKEMGFEIDLCTNGTISNKELLKQISYYLSEISVTLDGTDYFTHGYAKGSSELFNNTIDTIRYFSELGVDVHIITVVKKSNFNILIDIPEFVQKLGAQSITFLGLMNTSMYAEENISLKNIEAFLEKINFFRKSLNIKINTKRVLLKGPLGECQRGKTIFGISASGHFLPCILTPDLTECNNLRTNTIQLIVEKWLNRQSSLKIECTECIYNDKCKKGCPATGWLINQELSHDQNCWSKIYK